MTIEKIELVELIANEGYVLTNGETYSRLVYLGTQDSPKNWHEVPESEVPENWEL